VQAIPDYGCDLEHGFVRMMYDFGREVDDLGAGERQEPLLVFVGRPGMRPR
jgi:hypothetical protein